MRPSPRIQYTRSFLGRVLEAILPFSARDIKDRAVTTNAITHAHFISHATRIVTTEGVNTDAAFLAAAFQSYITLGSTAADVLTSHQRFRCLLSRRAPSDIFRKRAPLGYENCQLAETKGFGGSGGENGEDDENCCEECGEFHVDW
jgi:hypothetical protein